MPQCCLYLCLSGWENLYESDINHQVQEQNQQYVYNFRSLFFWYCFKQPTKKPNSLTSAFSYFPQSRTLVSVAQRVRLALQLFECLHFHRGQLFNSHITQLHGLADQLDQTSKKAKVAGITGGSMAAAAGIVLAPVTLGLSLAATAIGVGFAVGGAKGGSAAMTDKLYSSQERKKVEEILQEHKAQMKDVEDCLQFINMGIERLCKFEPLTLQGADKEVVKMTRIAQILGRNSDLRPAALSSDALDGFTAGMDIYFEKQPKKKKGLETKLAKKIRELAEQMKSGLDGLMDMRDKVRAAEEQVEMRQWLKDKHDTLIKGQTWHYD